MVVVGEIYFRPDFIFKDGDVADKLILILGESEQSFIVAKTTSQQHSRTAAAGCQGGGTMWHAWHIPLGTSNLSKATWICLDEVYETGKRAFESNVKAGVFKRISQIRPCPVLDCVLQSPSVDLSQQHVSDLTATQASLGC